MDLHWKANNSELLIGTWWNKNNATWFLCRRLCFRFGPGDTNRSAIDCANKRGPLCKLKSSLRCVERVSGGHGFSTLISPIKRWSHWRSADAFAKLARAAPRTQVGRIVDGQRADEWIISKMSWRQQVWFTPRSHLRARRMRPMCDVNYSDAYAENVNIKRT